MPYMTPALSPINTIATAVSSNVIRFAVQARTSAPNYRGIPGLVRKYYLYGDDRTGGGVYLWNSREAAERFYSEAWKSTIAAIWCAAGNFVLRDCGHRRERG
jgi:hypothetical protein